MFGGVHLIVPFLSWSILVSSQEYSIVSQVGLSTKVRVFLIGVLKYLDGAGPAIRQAGSCIVVLRVVCFVRLHSRLGELKLRLACLFHPILRDKGLGNVLNARPIPNAAQIRMAVCQTWRRSLDVV